MLGSPGVMETVTPGTYVSKPYRYARKLNGIKWIKDEVFMFQNLIGMLGSFKIQELLF